MTINNLQEYIQELERLNGHSNEIPKELLHSSMVVGGKTVHPKFKCRKTWFLGFYSIIELGLVKGYIGENIRKMYDAFSAYADETDLPGRLLIVREDIDRANKILTTIINELKG